MTQGGVYRIQQGCGLFPRTGGGEGGHSFVELAFKSGLDLRLNNGDG